MTGLDINYWQHAQIISLTELVITGVDAHNFSGHGEPVFGADKRPEDRGELGLAVVPEFGTEHLKQTQLLKNANKPEGGPHHRY